MVPPWTKWTNYQVCIYESVCCEICPFKLILLSQTVKLVEKWPMTDCLLHTLLIQLTHRRWWSSTIRMAFTFTEHLKGINDVSANTLTKFTVTNFILSCNQSLALYLSALDRTSPPLMGSCIPCSVAPSPAPSQPIFLSSWWPTFASPIRWSCVTCSGL